MDADQFIRDFAEAIPGLEPGKITPQTVLNDIPEWDSMSLLNIIP